MIVDSLIPEFDHEMGTTRRLLERVPEAEFSWKPHDKSISLGELSGHLSNLAGFYDDTYKSLVQSASTEPDANKRKQLYSQINDFLLDASYSMAICQYPNIMISRANLQGLRYATSLEWTMRDTWFA